jgi:YcaO-like protein with predicted kinase domain
MNVDLMTASPAMTDWRSASPEALLARLLPMLPTMGITRVADLSGLDRIGLPVAAAFRPNSRSLAVHQGRGLSRTAARVSAIMEAAECYHAETIDRPLRLARFGDIADAVNPMRLPKTAALPADRKILWIEGVDLASGRARWVPYELVHCDFTAPQPEGSYLFQATTNGLGAGATTDDAALHAVWEAIERDALARWRKSGGPGGPNAQAIDLGSVGDPACADLLRRLRSLGIGVAAWQAASLTGVPVSIALLMPEDGGLAGIEPELGSSCHADPSAALYRALSEAAQARITRIAGARDDYTPESYGPAARQQRLAEATQWFACAQRGASVSLTPIQGQESAKRRLDAVLYGLCRMGCDEVIWVDLSKSTLGICVGRVVIPGLQGPFQAGRS